MSASPSEKTDVSVSSLGPLFEKPAAPFAAFTLVSG